jgi:hypothetical protein
MRRWLCQIRKGNGVVKYVFREDAPIILKSGKDADPQVIGEALQKIAQLSGGELTPGAVVEAAKNRRHILHSHFEWDNVKAADAYRIDQARHLIRIIRVEDDAQDEAPRAFMSVRSESGVSYRSLGDVKKSSDFQIEVLRAAKRDLLAFRARYRGLQDVFPDIASAIEKIDGKLHENESHVAA